MKKRLVSIALSLVLALSVLPTAGLAAKADKFGTQGVINSSYNQYKPHDDSCADAELQMLEQMVDAANAKIEQLVKHAQQTPFDDVQWLLDQVDLTVAPVFAYAEAIGATVICEYVEYTVDGQTILVDPIRVIRG